MWVIVDRKVEGVTLFWSGGSWVAEYPDAKLYEHSGPALAVARSLARKDGAVEVVRGYGTDHQVVKIVSADGLEVRS